MDITDEYIENLKEIPDIISGSNSTMKTKVKSHDVQGSSSTYTIEEYSDGSFSCTCPHFKFGANPKGEYCKHIKKIIYDDKKSVDKDVDNAKTSLDDFFYIIMQ